MISLSFIQSLFLLVIASTLLRAIINAVVPFDSVRVAFFFPGIVIHEAAHAIVSRLLGVPVLEINFLKGEVLTDPEALAKSAGKRFIIAIGPLLSCWLIGGTFFFATSTFRAAGAWFFEGIFMLLGLSTFACASPSLTDVTTAFQNEKKAVTAAIWILVCGLLGFFTMLEQPFGVLDPFKEHHSEALAIGGAILSAILGYLVYRVAQNDYEESGKWIW